MDWSYNESKKAWELLDSGSAVAKIFLKEKDNPVLKYAAKTLISSVYTSSRTFDRLNRSGKEWKSSLRKFKTGEELAAYVEARKDAVKRRIEKF